MIAFGIDFNIDTNNMDLTKLGWLKAILTL
jgi:hypothetical protein